MSDQRVGKHKAVFFTYSITDDQGNMLEQNDLPMGYIHGAESGIIGKVEAALEKVRPALQADGGDVELVDVTDGVVKLKLKGACSGCPMSTMTLKMGIGRVLKEQIPEVKEVVAV